MTKELLGFAITGIALWAALGVASSALKAAGSNNNCGKNYPIDYVIYTNLFCEIKQ